MDRNKIFSRIWDLYESGGLLAMCAWCGRVRLDDGWLFPPRAALVAIDEPSVISHSICELCSTSFGERLNEHAYTRKAGALENLAPAS
jgi:hypothetical protein